MILIWNFRLLVCHVLCSLFFLPLWSLLEAAKKNIQNKLISISSCPHHTFQSNCIRFININEIFRGKCTHTEKERETSTRSTSYTRNPSNRRDENINKNLFNCPFSRCLLRHIKHSGNLSIAVLLTYFVNNYKVITKLWLPQHLSHKINRLIIWIDGGKILFNLFKWIVRLDDHRQNPSITN